MYNVVYEYESGSHKGCRFWTFYESFEDFKNAEKPFSSPKIVAQGVTQSEAVDLCKESRYSAFRAMLKDKSLTAIFGYRYDEDFNRQRIETLFRDFEKVADSFKNLFKDHPIFIYEGVTVEYNALLRKVEFFRVKNPNDAFQELYRWVSNRGNPEKKMPVIPDVMKIQAHGFDKYSFRRGKVE